MYANGNCKLVWGMFCAYMSCLLSTDDCLECNNWRCVLTASFPNMSDTIFYWCVKVSWQLFSNLPMQSLRLYLLLPLVLNLFALQNLDTYISKSILILTSTKPHHHYTFFQTIFHFYQTHHGLVQFRCVLNTHSNRPGPITSHAFTYIEQFGANLRTYETNIFLVDEWLSCILW